MADYIYNCPDMVHLIRVLICYYSNLESIYYNLVIQIFLYLFETLDLGITFIANSEDDLIRCINSNYTKLINS